MIKRFTLSLFLLLYVTLSYSQTEEWNKTDTEGNKFGEWRAFYPNGKLRYIGQFENDIAVDTFYYYFETGKLKTILVYDSLNSAIANLYYDTGELMASGRYVNQKKEGKWTTYGANNIKVEEGTFLDGKKYGKWINFYENGSISMEVNFENDLEEGPIKYYFLDGKLKRESIYENGLLNGLSVYYDNKGKKVLKGKYLKGARNGRWIYYDETQTIEKVLEYDKGRLLNPEILDEIDYDSEEFRGNIKDVLEFEDLRGKIKYD